MGQVNNAPITDELILSPQAIEAVDKLAVEFEVESSECGEATVDEPEASLNKPREAESESNRFDREFTPEEWEVVKELQATDRKVRSHEMAHLAAAGQNATSGASFDLQKGPTGRSYAVAGEVSIDTSSVEGDPEATIRKAQIFRTTVLAPASPSSQNRPVNLAVNPFGLAHWSICWDRIRLQCQYVNCGGKWPSRSRNNVSNIRRRIS
ncbi:MAG TPA: hypothetical protein EYG57_10025 [Planctomycetes bacterium]|nr:hypothetical protein [Planctomycetaceae bacterium]HIM29885.1 hypothetical protein [Planctomycetota bacterium]